MAGEDSEHPRAFRNLQQVPAPTRCSEPVLGASYPLRAIAMDGEKNAPVSDPAFVSLGFILRHPLGTGGKNAWKIVAVFLILWLLDFVLALAGVRSTYY